MSCVLAALSHMLSHCRTCQPLYLRPETRFFLPATLDPMRPPLYDGNRYCTGAATIESKSCEASLTRHSRRITDACGDAQTGALEFIETQIRHARSTERCVGSSHPRFNLPSGRRLLKGGRVARVARAEPGLKLCLCLLLGSLEFKKENLVWRTMAWPQIGYIYVA